MAIQDYYEQFVFIEKRSESDGMGGFEVAYVEGATFMAGINIDNSTEMKIAEQQGLKTVYSINTDKNVPLQYQDIVLRKKDNTYFRITSNPNDLETPTRANISFKLMSAEKIDLPAE